MRACPEKKGQDPLVPLDKDAHVPTPDLRKCPHKKKKKGANKDPAVLPDKHDAPVPPDLQKYPPENNFMTTVLVPVGTCASNEMLPNTRAQEIPTLPAIQTQEARYPTRGNQTPATEPPKVIGCPPPERFGMTGDDGDVLSTTFSKVEEDDGDDFCDVFNDNDDLDDDDLFYSDDELDEEFKRDLDEVARAIEYSDHKNFNHGRHCTTLIMADACHLNFGKYTLFSCYGIIANCNMSPAGFAIVFGHENGTTWKEFWKFLKEVHPTMSLPDVTIVTDQDKGKKSAISEVMDQAGHFHCAHHRRGNIIKMCGAASGNRIYSALWVYNRLVGCQTVEQIEREKTSSMPMMHVNVARYLNNLDDDEQYPAARCNKYPGIYMYHRSASAGAESMSGANIKMRAKSAVDLLNALILLTKLECKRFNAQCAKAWASDCFLTPRGTVE